MRIVLNTSESYKLSELAKAVENSPDDLFYVVKQVDGKDVSFAITREQLLQGIETGGTPGIFIVRGGVYYTGVGMIFQVDATVSFYGTDVEIFETVTLDNGDSEPRRDTIRVNSEGDAGFVKGVPDPNPVAPGAGEGWFALADVLVNTGSTTPEITLSRIYREGFEAGYTGVTYAQPSGATQYGSVDFVSPIDPCQGTLSIRVNTSKTTGIRINFGSALNISNFDKFVLKVRFPVALAGNKTLLMSVWNGGSSVGQAINISSFGLSNSFTDCQTIEIPTQLFPTQIVDRLQIRLDGGAADAIAEYFLDDIFFTTGTAASVPLDILTIQKGGANVGTRPKLNFIEGANTTITVVDDPVNDRVNVTITATGGGGGGGTVVSISGTTNQINVDNSDPANPVLSLSNAILTQLTQIGINTSDIATLDDRFDDLEGDVILIETDIENIQADYVKSTADFDTAGRVVIVDSAGRKVVQGSKLLADLITEADVIGTPRQYTAGQGTTLGTLTIASGSVTPDIAAKNAYSLAIDQNVTINAPSNDRCTSWFIRCEITGVGGWTIGLNSAYKPDGGAALTIPNTTGDKFTLYVQSFGDGTHDITIHTQQ